ncbi:MAG: DegT/DnrJ/EryC1/StrS family aminotransferase [Acidimicrobiales bacterium]
MTEPPGWIPLNDLQRAYGADSAALDAAIASVVSSGWYTMGEQVAGFEAELASSVGTAHCIGVASGSDALELSLRAVGCRPGDDVVTAGNAGGYSTLAAIRVGARPRFADVAEETLTITAESVEAALTATTTTVIVTHLYGRLATIEPLVELCERRGLALVEDCAQAAGAERGGRRAGSFGHAAAFSFYPTKNLGAMGDGGAVTTNRDDVADAVRSLRQYGWGDRYHVERSGGFNSRLDEIQAAILRTRLPGLASANDRRRQLASRYAAAVPEPVGRLLQSGGPDFTAHLGVLVCSDRDQVRERFAAAGVATAVHYPVPDHHQPILANSFRDVALPMTEYAADHVLTVPLFPELRDEEIERIIGVLEACKFC